MSARRVFCGCIAAVALAQGVCGERAEQSKLADNSIFHIGHSANLVKIGGKVLVFDYPYGTQALADIFYPLQPEDLQDQRVYVFASHTHGDHYNTGILSWKEKIPAIKYILSYDIPRRPADAVVVRPGKMVQVDGMKVRAYPSTDAGVAFSVYVEGRHIYFSGDNGYWNWDKDKSEEDYVLEALSCIDRSAPIDIAFQVCMTKAEGIGEGGIGIFAEMFQPRLLIPIHSQGDYSINKKVEGQLRERGFKGRYWPISGKSQSLSFADLPQGKIERKEARSLHDAAALGDANAATTLISAGADVNTKNADGRSPLHLAAAMGGMETAKVLIEAGADVNAKDKYGWTPLHVAVRAYKLDVVELLLHRGAQVDAKCGSGRTPLDVAVSIGADAIVGVLVNGGADVNAAGGTLERTPLHSAVELRDVALVKLILSKGAKVNAADRLGTPPLFLAAEGGHRDVVQTLIESGADVKAKDKDGRTALHWAAMSGMEDMAALLIDKGADVNIEDRYGHTPLKIAVLTKREEIAELLRAHGGKEQADE